MTKLRVRGPGYSLVRAFLWFAMTLATSVSTQSLADNIDLSLAPGINPGEVQLSWTGGVGPYQVHRSAQASVIVSSGDFIGETANFSYSDVSYPPAGGAVFYVVVDEVCGDGIVDLGETCDDGNIVPGDGCSSTCQVEVATNVTTVDLSCVAPLFFAYQDGDGPWTALNGTGGLFQFTFSSTYGAFAYVSQINTQIFTWVYLLTQTEAAGATYNNCYTPPSTKSVTGAAAGLGADDTAWFGL